MDPLETLLYCELLFLYFVLMVHKRRYFNLSPVSFSTAKNFGCRELARALGDKGVIDFADVEHVIMKGMLFFSFQLNCLLFFLFYRETC